MMDSGPMPGTGASPFLTLADDIADWGGRFLGVLERCGPEAAQQVLGGIAEWLGTDLVDGMPQMAMERWQLLDGLAEELLQTCRDCIEGKPDARERVATIISRARELGESSR